nr:hypothetical protein [Paraburkholderia xenovorans]
MPGAVGPDHFPAPALIAKPSSWRGQTAPARARRPPAALGQTLVYVAVAPKSNAVSVAWHQALSFVRTDRTRAVPMYLRNAPHATHEGFRLQEGLPLRA